MKRILITAALAIASIGAAQAQILPKTFKSSNAQVFSIDEVRSVEGANGYVYVIYKGGNLSGPEYTDSNGSVFANVKASAGFYDQFVQVPGTNRFVNVQAARRVQCAGNRTTITYIEGGSEDFNGDGCALYSAINARAK